MPQGWKWIVPDIRGHGETQIWKGALCSMEACTEDLVRLWDALGVEKSHLVGYSMGGRLALHVAARRPERVLSVLTIGAHAGLDEDAREGRRRGWAATVPNGRLEIVSRAGHAAHQERPDAIARVLAFHLAAATAVGASSSSTTSD